jgi:hypothetical protein
LAGLERDAAIISLGVCAGVVEPSTGERSGWRFGVLDGRYGRACLITALSRSRRCTTVVSAVTASELRARTVLTDGAVALRDLLSAAEDPVTAGNHQPPAFEADDTVEQHIVGRDRAATTPANDSMTRDLRERLIVAGLPVTPGPQAPDWPMALAVADRDHPERRLLAVEVDGTNHARCPSVTLRDRQRPESFERAGWAYLRVAAMDLFCDPGREVERIRTAWRAAGGGAHTTIPNGLIVGRPRMRDGFPDVTPGRPVSTYSDVDLEAVGAWVMTDGVPRTDVELATVIRESLLLSSRGSQVQTAVNGAARRVLSRTAQS